MAANCMGTFGTYQYMSRHKPDNSTVWVTKRYIPTDLRVNAPVPRQKPLAPNLKDLPAPAKHWVPPRDPLLHMVYRSHEETQGASQPSTRCEEWSTLRQMLPSRGRPSRIRPANWGTHYAPPPSMEGSIQRRFPHINSPMTRYVDDMHGTNRLFRLY